MSHLRLKDKCVFVVFSGMNMLFMSYRSFGNSLGNCLGDREFLKYLGKTGKVVSHGMSMAVPHATQKKL